MADINPRLRAVLDLNVAESREYAGRHEYDGKIQDLSPDGVRAGLARLTEAAAGPTPLDVDRLDEYDAAHLTVFERAARVSYEDLQLYRANPLYHVSNLDLA